MATIAVPNSGAQSSFEVMSATSIRYNGQIYQDVTTITFPDGTVKTCAQIIQENGGAAYAPDELKACVKVEGYDPDQNGRQVFTVYSTNSAQAGKNEVGNVPGGMWVEMFDFGGDADSNHVLQLWKNYFAPLGVDYLTQFDPTWVGFKLNYGISEGRSYVMTYVDDFGQESVPCPPADIGITFMHAPRLRGVFTGNPTISAGGFVHRYAPTSALRLYRSSVTSTGVAIYQQVPQSVELEDVQPPSIGRETFPRGAVEGALYFWHLVDITENDALTAVLGTVDYDCPPAQEMLGLTDWKNGMLLAFWKNTVKVCEPFKPWAWPAKYQIPLPVPNILGFVVDENSVVAITDKEPFLLTGSHPANLNAERMENVQAGIRPQPNRAGIMPPTRAACRVPGGVVYLSREGPIGISGGRGQALTRALFTREEFTLRYGDVLDRMRLAYHDGRLLAYVSGDERGFVLVVGDTPALVQWDLPYTGHRAVGDTLLPLDDQLLLFSTADEVSATALRLFDPTQPRLAASYWTRDFVLPKPENLGVIEVLASGTGRVTAFVYANGGRVAEYTFTFADSNERALQRRLPGGLKARRWNVLLTIDPDVIVSQVALASTPGELQGA
jgi:hypothetical protein